MLPRAGFGHRIKGGFGGHAMLAWRDFAPGCALAGWPEYEGML